MSSDDDADDVGESEDGSHVDASGDATAVSPPRPESEDGSSSEAPVRESDEGGSRSATEAESTETPASNATAGNGDLEADVRTESAPETSPEVRVDDVALSYDDGEPVVEADTLVVPAGEVTALVGPNGSGKSTLLKAMSAELSPDRGVVALDGRDVHEYGTAELAREVGLLAQEHTAPNSTTVRDLAIHGRYPHRGFLDSLDESDHEAVDRALTRVGVEHLADREVGSLSGGQKQLAWLAMVLAQETDVLLLDEPTTFLDLHHQLRVLDAVRALNDERGVTVCVVLHDLEQAARFADNLIALKDGEPYDWGPPNEVVTAELVESVFGVAADVGYGPRGPRVTPREPLED